MCALAASPLNRMDRREMTGGVARVLLLYYVVLRIYYMRTPSLLVVALGCSALQTPPPPARRTAAAPNYACGPASKPAPPVQLPADKQVDISIEH